MWVIDVRRGLNETQINFAPSHKIKAVGMLDEAVNVRINYTKTIQFPKNKGSANWLTL